MFQRFFRGFVLLVPPISKITGCPIRTSERCLRRVTGRQGIGTSSVISVAKEILSSQYPELKSREGAGNGAERIARFGFRVRLPISARQRSGGIERPW